MSLLPLAADQCSTHDASTVTVASLTLADGFFGQVEAKLSGERDLVPTACYGCKFTACVSCEAGVATVRSLSAVTEIDPGGITASVAATVDASGATIRMRCTGIAAQDWRWAASFKGEERARVEGALAALGATAYYAAQYPWTNTPYQDFAYTGAEILLDPGCENVALWLAGGGAVLSNVADPRPGSAGANCMRVTLAGGAGNAYETARFVTTQRFRVTAWLKTDATATEYIYDGVNACFPAFLSGVWTEKINNNFLPGNTIFYAHKLLAAGSWVQIDDASIVRLPILTQTDSLITGGAALVQAGAAGLRPTYLPLAAAVAQGLTCPCWQFDGVSGGQHFVGPNPGAAFTMFAWVRRHAALDATARAPFGSSSSGPTRQGRLQSVAGGNWFWVVGTDSGDMGVASPLGTWQFVALGWNGAGAGRCVIDATEVNFAYAGTATGFAVDFGGYNNNGVHASGAFPAYQAAIGMAGSLLTAVQIQAIRTLTRPQGV